jgi:hypothetical protein
MQKRGPATSATIPEGCARARKRWRGRADAGELADEPPGPPAGEGNDWRACTDFRMDVTLDGERLSAAEIKRLLAHSDGLVLIRGKWVEIDHEGLRRTLDKFEAIERRAASDGLSFGEAMRMLAGAGIAENDSGGQADIDWGEAVAGPWRRRWRLCAAPTGSLGSIPGNPCKAHCGPINWRVCNGFICSPNSGSEPALPTTWVSARPFRSCRCCWC